MYRVNTTIRRSYAVAGTNKLTKILKRIMIYLIIDRRISFTIFNIANAGIRKLIWQTQSINELPMRFFSPNIKSLVYLSWFSTYSFPTVNFNLISYMVFKTNVPISKSIFNIETILLCSETVKLCNAVPADFSLVW